MKKILFLHDTYTSLKRGAELTITQLVALGNQLGYFVEVDLLTDFELTKSKIQQSDLIVLNSTSRCRFEKKLLSYLVDKKINYVKIEFDYNFCIRRNILCTVDRGIRNCCDNEKYHLYHEVFGNAKLNAFQSPKHFEDHYAFYGESVANKIIMAPTVEVDKLQISEIKNDSIIPFFGDISYLKGGEALLDYALENPQFTFQVYGKNELRRDLPSNVFLNDYIPNEEVLKILGQSKHFFCKPVWPEPSGRLAAEAFLSGCEMITNDRVGTWSFDFYPNDKERAEQEMKETPQIFWDNISRILNQNETEDVPDLGNVLVYKSYGGLGDIFFCLPSLINLKEVSKSVSFAVHPRLVSFFTKYFKEIIIVDEEKIKEKEADFDKIIELGNYPAFRGYDLPHAIRYSTHKKVKQHSIQHHIDGLAKFHKNYSNQSKGYPYFERDTDYENPYYTVHPGAGFLLKIWPTENYAKLIEELHHLFPKLKCKIILGKEDPNPADFFTKEMPHIDYVTGGLDDIGKAMESAFFHIGNDAGITHVAGAFNVPTVGIYGPTGPGSWGSFAKFNEIIWGKKGNCDLRCNYDVILNCPDRVCLSSTTVPRVLNALYSLLQKAYEEIAFDLKVNPLLEVDFSEKDCLLKINENELLIEYRDLSMKNSVEEILKGNFKDDFSEEEESLIHVFIEQQVIFCIPELK
ncbi:MAG TPA: glycosyltransferase family 9 protein [Flavobacterium sp.]|uniref:glycosyltransferase family 9 protein n=1 Tax=unclassified Flavobacterium TaxID=196869 RepID=UPI0025C2329C|nr:MULTISPECIES: glycosyltransferase family 9 protein [unclassified Flavobacterium]HRE77705.1 glycosyltransferase family 9 protein [Flavobacterium sp.]